MSTRGMEFVIISGLSGAGKTIAMHSLEDIGFYCVDNLPVQLLLTFYDLCGKSTDTAMKRVAVVADARGEGFSNLLSALKTLRAQNKPYKILYLCAEIPVLTSRFNQTRRKHPLSKKYSGSIEQAIKAEIELTNELKQIADYVFDTGKMSAIQLKERIISVFSSGELGSMSITCMSFGFKYGIPSEAHLVFDVRCMPNPFYVSSLKHKTGNDKDVADYVFGNEESIALFDKIMDYISFSLPLYASEGKSHLVIAVGCTGGKHRSVAVADKIYNSIKSKNTGTSVYHRDINKE